MFNFIYVSFKELVNTIAFQETVFYENDFALCLLSSLEICLLKMERVSMGPVALCLMALRELWLGLPPAFMPLWDLTALQQLVRAASWFYVEGKVFLVLQDYPWVAAEGQGKSGIWGDMGWFQTQL